MAAWSGRKRRRGYPSASSSYESNPCFSANSQKRFPKSVSQWDIHFLEKLGINYDPKAIPLSEFMEKIKTYGMEVDHVHILQKPFPNFISSIEKFTARALNFSFTETPERFNKEKPTFVMEHFSRIESVCATMDKIQHEEFELKERDDETKEKERLFMEWMIRIKDFMIYYKRFLEDEVSSVRKTENKYMELFMNFSRIFFLVPELGNNECRKIEIGELTQSCIPDVRFFVLAQAWYKPTLLVVLTEVKQFSVGKKKKCSEDDDGEEIFDIRSALNKNILGQFGGELLGESERSAFYPAVVGTICKRTEVIFAFMDMEHQHFMDIKDTGESAEHSCMISYTKPYNFLLEKDRNELLPLLFWLGFLQSIDSNKKEK